MEDHKDEMLVFKNEDVTQSSKMTATPTKEISSTNDEVMTPRNLINWERQLIAQERRLLEEERELLKLKIQMIEMNATRQTKVTKINARDVAELIPEFDPGSSTSLLAPAWVERVTAIATTYSLDDLSTALYAAGKLRGTARLWYNTISDQLTIWSQLKERLVHDFPTARDEGDVHLELVLQKRTKGEAYEEYFYRMSAIAHQAAISKRSLIKYIIAGINDDEMMKTLATAECEEPQQLLKKMKLYEDTASLRKVVESKISDKQLSKKPESTRTLKTKDITQTSGKCFSCGERNHVAQDCPHKSKGMKCFNCNEFGHKANICPEKRKTNVNMVRVNQDFHKTVTINDKEYEALLDTGSARNIVAACVVSQCPETCKPINLWLEGLGGASVKCLSSTNLTVNIDGRKFNMEAVVVPDAMLPVKILLGIPFLSCVSYVAMHGKIHLLGSKDEFEVSTPMNENSDEEIQKMLRILLIDDMTVDVEDENLPLNVSQEHRKSLRSIIQMYKPEIMNKTMVETKIILNDKVPVAQPPRRLSLLEKKEVDTQITEWLKQGIIQPSSSEYSSPVVLVKKKSGETRICIDFRQLNRKVVRDRYPLPLIEDQLDKLQQFKVFSTLDLKNGFFHVPVEKDSRKYLSFVTHSGQYEFLRTPFGFCNSPAVFQRYVNEIFQPLVRESIVALYLDDIVVLAQDENEALVRLKQVLGRASSFGLQINWRKCQFLTRKIQYLGYIIENGELRPNGEKIAAVINFPRPSTVKRVQRFLGLTGYFRKFVEDYANIAKPLSNLLKKEQEFQFGVNEEIAFTELKKRLAEGPVLTIYNPNAETELHTDASRVGIGAILLQRTEDKIFFITIKLKLYICGSQVRPLT